MHYTTKISKDIKFLQQSIPNLVYSAIDKINAMDSCDCYDYYLLDIDFNGYIFFK